MELYEKPQKSRVIIGFPGFGLIGTITTDFLIEHLKTRLIGKILLKNMPNSIAIHNGKMIEPIGIYYNEEYNIVIIKGMVSLSGLEWEITEEIEKILNELNPYDIIDIEGIASPNQNDECKIYFFSNNKDDNKKLSEMKYEPIKEGIIIGITSTILLKIKRNIVCFFVESHSELPDSKSASKIIEVLDEYLNLKIDNKPLLKQAEIFESKLKGILQKSILSKKEIDKKNLSYVG
jgi:uncharacterized protein